uniref:Uncharacterized protein n=1 Tax=Salix viminalis TaxID=40686 RepID=A0A6N2LKK2_SALVM
MQIVLWFDDNLGGSIGAWLAICRGGRKLACGGVLISKETAACGENSGASL